MCFASLCKHRKNYNQISKTNNTQNYQKIERYGSLTTKDLKKPHSSRWVGGAELQRWRGKLAERTVPHLRVVDKNQEGYLGSEQSQPQPKPQSPGFQHWKKKKTITSGYKNLWGLGQQR